MYVQRTKLENEAENSDHHNQVLTWLKETVERTWRKRRVRHVCFDEVCFSFVEQQKRGPSFLPFFKSMSECSRAGYIYAQVTEKKTDVKMNTVNIKKRKKRDQSVKNRFIRYCFLSERVFCRIRRVCIYKYSQRAKTKQTSERSKSLWNTGDGLRWTPHRR